MILRIILASFAVYRLSQLIAWDNGPGYMFQKLRTHTKFKADTEWGIWQNIDEAVNCPYCLGIWFSGLMLFIINFQTKAGDLILYIFGIGGIQAFLQGLTKER